MYGDSEKPPTMKIYYSNWYQMVNFKLAISEYLNMSLSSTTCLLKLLKQQLVGSTERKLEHLPHILTKRVKFCYKSTSVSLRSDHDLTILNASGLVVLD